MIQFYSLKREESTDFNLLLEYCDRIRMKKSQEAVRDRPAGYFPLVKRINS